MALNINISVIQARNSQLSRAVTPCSWCSLLAHRKKLN